MKNKAIYTCVCTMAGFLLASPCFGQGDNKLGFNIGAGFTAPSGPSHSRVDTGFNLGAGVAYNVMPHVGVQLDFGYNQLGLKSSILSAVGVPDGEARLYSLTLNPIVHLNPHGNFDAYIIGGGGYYHRTVEFTVPTVTTVTAFDPFFGFFPLDVPANQVVGSYGQNKGGLNIGAGASFRVKADSNAKFYAESRYHYVYTSPIRTTVWPVTFGFRW